MYSLRNLCITLILALAATLMVGCGGNIFENLADSDSEEAKKEAARIALDEGNYPEAVSILEGLCGTDLSNLTCDDDSKRDLASTYIAIATELDALQLIAKAEEAAASPTGSFTTVSTLLPIDAINDCAANPSTTCPMKEDMENAITILNGLLASSDPSDPNLTDEEQSLYLQLAVASAVNIVVTVGIASEGLDANGKPVNSPQSESDLPADTLSDITSDVNNVVDGIQGSGIGGTEFTDDINTIKSELDEDGNGFVIFSELQGFISTLQQ